MRGAWGADLRSRTAVAALLLWALALHVVFFASAGALWRDEANSAAQARLPSWGALWESLRYDTFPMLYPALLRVWMGLGGGTDAGLRTLGLLTGIALIVSLWFAGRIAGVRRPLFSILLVAAAPLVVSEADSVRPYGIGLIFLAWTFAAMARCIEEATAGRLAAASALAVLTVQSGYAGAVPVGVLALCAAAVPRGGGIRARAALLVPAVAAALSVLCYVAPLRAASEWASIVRQPVDWRAFADRFVGGRSLLFAAAWGAACVVAAAGARLRSRNGAAGRKDVWCGLVAVAAVPVQFGFLWLQGVPPFPRYFLTALVPMALSLDALSRGARLRVPVALIAAAITALPSWGALRQRRTNADDAGAILTAQADAKDLVVVSPWFLHPSLERYYAGRAEWVTAPVLPRAPMMRYDLVKAAMLEGPRGGDPGPAIEAALGRGGAVWLVAQRRFRSPAQAEPPARPPLREPVDGRDYARFRSYWERGVESALARCCAGEERPGAAGQAVWDEEDLVVIRWTAKPAGR